jgi:PHD/YefM family antitoxin component YafN of YafNO toxin-antitoxin module
MSDAYPMTVARANFGSLVRRTANSRERIAITDHGHTAAILINPTELAELEEALAVAEYKVRKANGTAESPVPHSEVLRMLGLPPE